MSNEVSAARPGHGFLFRARVRAAVRAELDNRSKLAAGGVTAGAVPDLMAQVTDAMIDEAADAELFGAVPTAGFLDWLRQHQDVVRRVVDLILAALLGS